MTDEENLLLVFKNNLEVSAILKKLVDYATIDLGYAPTVILKRYLMGVEIVYASEIDSRIIRQNGLFIIWGLACLDKIIDGSINNKSKNERQEILNEIQNGIDEILGKLEFLYLPKSFLGQGIKSGNVRIRIKNEFKEQILSELKLLGITAQSFYPDLQHKLEYIKNLRFK